MNSPKSYFWIKKKDPSGSFDAIIAERVIDEWYLINTQGPIDISEYVILERIENYQGWV